MIRILLQIGRRIDTKIIYTAQLPIVWLGAPGALTVKLQNDWPAGKGMGAALDR